MRRIDSTDIYTFIYDGVFPYGKDLLSIGAVQKIKDPYAMIDKHCIGPFNIDRCAFERRYSTGKIIRVTPLKSRAFYMNGVVRI